MNDKTQNNGKTGRKPAREAAFTLIEMLVVIAIIGTLAALIIPTTAGVMARAHVSRVKSELNQYVTAIETYKLQLNGYPPDNGLLAANAASTNTYNNYAALNPLFYELSGAVFMTNRQFQIYNSTSLVDPTVLKQVFNQSGIQNSARAARDVPYQGMNFKGAQYRQLKNPSEIQLLAVPVKGPADVELDGTVGKINPWHYDSSSTNRHNRRTFDLWAEVIVKGQRKVIGNWKD